ncbi:MAG: carbonic anhydrase [Beijerinckiaceae bacterium]
MTDTNAINRSEKQTVGQQRLLLPARLVAGYEVFLGGRFRREQDRYRQLGAIGQKPNVLLIGCCDSRVSPEVIFDADPGEIFVVRNVANLVPPYAPNDDLHGTSAALEFAVMSLQVQHIVVMGHASCGGVRAFLEYAEDPQQKPLSPSDFIGKWMALIAPVAEKLGVRTEPFEAYVERLGKAAIIATLANLRSFPWVREAEARGDLWLHGAYFGVSDGLLLGLDEASGQFLPIAGEIHSKAVATGRF